MVMDFREILFSHPVANLKKEISKVKKGFNYGKLSKVGLVNLMIENKDLFKHIKFFEPQRDERGRRKRPLGEAATIEMQQKRKETAARKAKEKAAKAKPEAKAKEKPKFKIKRKQKKK